MHDITIEPGRVSKNYWYDLWRYRELFYVLAWRDISVRYKQTAVGVLWALLQPLAAMAVMTVVFSRIANLPSQGGAPYSIMVFAAMLPWQFFSTSLTSASQSVVANANLVSKVYFPRMLIPAGAVITSFVDFAISFLILLCLMAWHQFWPSWRILTLPLFAALAFVVAMGPGLLITALNVKYRDFRYVVPFLTQFGLYVSPVGFSSEVVHQKLGDTAFLIYSLNPMVAVIDGFRWAILGGDNTIYGSTFIVSSATACLLLGAGVWYFRKTEKAFADIV